MATGTYKVSTSPTPVYGTSSEANKALQIKLNTDNAGKAGYTPLVVDGKYGDLTKAATTFAPTPAPVDTAVKYDSKTGKLLNPTTASTTGNTTATVNTTDPTITSDSYRASVDALNNKITEYQTKLKSENEADIQGIKDAYEAAKVIQDARQNKDYAGRSTGLVTSGGGFLGATQSQQGVLQNLNDTFNQEKQALMAKRDAAIQASRNAYDAKSYALAMEQLKNAKDAEQELYNRQKDAADQKLALSREARAQDEYDRGVSQDKAKAYAMMDDATFKKTDTSSVDAAYYPGYAADYRDTVKKAEAVKNTKDQLEVQNDIYTLLNKVPAGRQVSIGGKNYAGLKPSSNGVSLKDVITPQRAAIVGLPSSVAGMKEKDVVLSLELSKPAAWFVTALENAKQQSLSDATIAQEWNALRNDPDMEAYRNTIKLDQRHGVNAGNDDLAAAIDAIAGSDTTQQ